MTMIGFKWWVGLNLMHAHALVKTRSPGGIIRMDLETDRLCPPLLENLESMKEQGPAQSPSAPVRMNRKVFDVAESPALRDTDYPRAGVSGHKDQSGIKISVARQRRPPLRKRIDRASAIAVRGGQKIVNCEGVFLTEVLKLNTLRPGNSIQGPAKFAAH